MATPGHPLAYIAIFLGLLFYALGHPLAHDKVPPNMFYGFRTPQTMRDPDSWYRANRVGGRVMQQWAIVLGLSSIAMAFMTQQQALPVYIVVVFGGVIWLLVASLRAAANTTLPGAPSSDPEAPSSSPKRKLPVR